MKKCIYKSFEDMPLTLRIEDVMAALSVGRNTAYRMVKDGTLRTIRVGKQYRIPKSEIARYIDNLTNNDTATQGVRQEASDENIVRWLNAFRATKQMKELGK